MLQARGWPELDRHAQQLTREQLQRVQRQAARKPHRCCGGIAVEARRAGTETERRVDDGIDGDRRCKPRECTVPCRWRDPVEFVANRVTDHGKSVLATAQRSDNARRPRDPEAGLPPAVAPECAHNATEPKTAHINAVRFASHAIGTTRAGSSAKQGHRTRCGAERKELASEEREDDHQRDPPQHRVHMRCDARTRARGRTRAIRWRADADCGT